MKNVMVIGDEQAVISFHPDTERFRGEFACLNGGADFYASDIDGLRREGEASLRMFLDGCAVCGIHPRKLFSGRLVLRVTPELHEAAAMAATARGRSLDQWAVDAIRKALQA